MPMNGLGQGTLPIVGYNLGAKREDRIRQACKVSLLVGSIIGMAGTVIFVLCPGRLLALFAASSTMAGLGIPALRIISVIFAFSSATMIIGYIISGLGNGTVNMTATALRQLILLLPFVWLFGRWGGISHVWYAFWIAEGCAFLYAVWRLRKYIQNMQ